MHIADVAHFVRPQDVIDVEAQQRGTSSYLINRVIPMLPEVLSNGLCSLRPREDRYALSVIMDINKQGKVTNCRPVSTIINSKHRLAYEEALAIIERKEEPDQWPDDLLNAVRQSHRLAQLLRKNRVKNGSLNLYSQEPRFILDENGIPVEIIQESGDVAHELIEEFMLLANTALPNGSANEYQQCPIVFTPIPDDERLEQFAQYLHSYGLGKVPVGDRAQLQNVLRRLEQEPPAARLVLNYLCLRAFQKAIYSIEDVGHYALAFPHYVHFTSPIRRYPDLLVHRLVKSCLDDEGGMSYQPDMLDALCRQSSYAEQRAEGAERNLHSIKAARFLKERIGDVCAGVVTTATGVGLYVRLMETGLDGLIPMREIGEDYYQFDADKQALIARSSGYILGTGLEVDVSIQAVDIMKGQITLSMVSKREKNSD